MAASPPTLVIMITPTTSQSDMNSLESKLLCGPSIEKVRIEMKFSCLVGGSMPGMSSSQSTLTKAKCHYSSNTSMTSISLQLRREFLSLAAVAALSVSPARAATDEEYAKETEEVINKVRETINMERTDPRVAEAVAELRVASNSWVAKYRREKGLLGRVSFRDVYSALNAVSGHYVSFGPTTPIPSKRKVRILEEIGTAEKALLRGR